MSGKKRELSPEEKHLWRRVATSVKPRRSAKADAEDAQPEPPPKPRAKLAAKSPPAEPKPRVKPPAPVANRGAEKKVRRGQVEIDGRLDLHGHTQDAALAALRGFLQRAQSRGARAVLVITGAGRGGEGVLKRRLPDWLNAPDLRAIVAGFAAAHRSHGGAGAFYVFVKRKE